MAAPSSSDLIRVAGSGDGKRPQFGTRYLTDPSRVFQHNAWDNVEWSEEQEAMAYKKVQENCVQLASPEKQAEYENRANEYWNDFYKIHKNHFFKDRHWLFTEFPELAPNCKQDTVERLSMNSQSDDPGNSGPQALGKFSLENCENRCCHLKHGIQESDKLDREHINVDLRHTQDSHNLDMHVNASDKLRQMKLSNDKFPGASATYCILEVGCGVGNTVFPILQINNDPGLFVYCCDFSATAMELVQNHPDYDPTRCFSFVHDLCDEGSSYPMPDGSLDIIILIFVLSAIHPDKMQMAINHLSKLLKPGGMILLRDYGRYDMAQLRFKKGRCLSENFYVRGDGTRVYFFTQDDLESLFTVAGLEKVQNIIDRRLQVNRGKQLKMYRVWIQCKYRKPLS
ncbi:tRNA N(3)-methylcytidine methyltransferase METTL2 isoform X2 [Latimeria chalumnae]|uniref:tRNA N(3)-cytidine methyltransferase n=1 Tax=Latimeria chalumnae TaxID=7897 RepID=M3XHJ3_LATCH|nr:PREDICTED: methyltransferase-like protein 2 isoform X2 [Latimeria chalumnae]|eukprot:XP_006007518.1 PREDICTED: methyltransferase-like protein 2 isoform X2 [Latimeria chalumnae]